MDRDLEKSSTQSGEDAEECERTFAPIQSATRPSLSRRSSATRTLSRVLSQNGYSCSNVGSEEDEPQPAEEPEKDPFEVGFEGGDADPMCPRSFNKLRKWIIVVIVSQASFCV